MPPLVLHLMRHGATQMNEYLGSGQPHATYGSPAFVDPQLHDTRLTARGEQQARAAAARVRRLSPPPELLVVSPHTRALKTAALALGLAGAQDGGAAPPPCRVIVHPLWRERLYLSSDVGRTRRQLHAEEPELARLFEWDSDHWPEEDGDDACWWHTETPGDPLAVHEEPDDVFEARIERLREWIAGRPESVVAAVSHWGVLRELLPGKPSLENCQVVTARADAVLRRPPGARAGVGAAAAAWWRRR